MPAFEKMDVQARYEDYPHAVQERLLALRQLIFDVARETAGVGVLEETLKWGQPSYLCKTGSTIRVDWVTSDPQKCAMYFHCGTKLVATFRELYGSALQCEGKRAIVLDNNQRLPVNELKHCIALALTYHRVKHLPLLGA